MLSFLGNIAGLLCLMIFMFTIFPAITILQMTYVFLFYAWEEIEYYWRKYT
jgi:hypothetical protein